ncbi:MAG: lipopolysaccharide transport periplasmic protein LptA [Syntrophorhabdus sp.]
MRKFVLLLIVCLVFVSCGTKEIKKTENPVDLYVSGVNLMQKKKYEDAIKKFTAIREQYPFDPMALVAAVKLGDAYFLKKDYVLAAGTYEDYFKAHPDEENIPYVLFRLGECYEKLSPTVDRDQANTVKGIERITYLRNRYPNNSYAKESEPRLKAFVQKLADRELYIGEFYFRTSQYNAAIMRLENMLKQFPDLKNTDKSLFYLYNAHRELGNQEKSNQYLEMLRTKYPKSIYARSTVRERKKLNITDAERGKITSAPTTNIVPAVQAQSADSTLSRSDFFASPEVTTMAPPPAGQLPPIGADPQLSPPPQAGSPQPLPAAQYTSPKKREIDLKPPAPLPQPAGQSQTTVPPAKPEGDSKPDKQATAVSPQPLADKPKGAPQAVNGRPAGEPVKTAAADKPKTESKETGKASDKALGFLDQKKPIDIISDTMEGFDKEKYVFFKGNVVAKQDDLYIYSDLMEAYMSPDTNEIDKANAKGHVRIIKQNRTATCQEAYFDNVKGTILLKGNAVVTSGKDRVEGDEVTYYVNEDRAVVTAQKEKKAKVTIYPQKDNK